MDIPEKNLRILQHYLRILLYHKKEIQIKKKTKSNYDVNID